MDNAPFASSPATLVDKPIATVLVVDDTPENLTLMGSLLREHYLVKVANHGEKALKIAQSATPPDLILLDIMMPCLLYTSPSPRDRQKSRMPSSA